MWLGLKGLLGLLGLLQLLQLLGGLLCLRLLLSSGIEYGRRGSWEILLDHIHNAASLLCRGCSGCSGRG